MSQKEKIIRAVAKKHGVAVTSLLSPRRWPELVRARQAAAIRMREELKLSLPEIGRALNRDHSSILHLLNRAAL